MEIGKTRRIITIVPLDVPVPQKTPRELPEPVRLPEKEKVPA